MIAPCLLAALLSSAPAEGARISAGERAEAVLFVLAPPGAAPRTRSAAILEAARVALEATAVDLVLGERRGLSSAALRECSADERLGCWLRQVHPPGATEAPRYLLVVGAIPVGAEDELSVILLDAERAWSRVERLGPSATPEEVEQTVFETALQIPPQRLAPNQEEALLEYFRSVIKSELGARLEEDQNAHPPGSLRLEVEPAEISLELEGKRLGTLTRGQTLLTDLRPGSRQLSVERSGGQVERFRVEIASGTESLLTISAPRPQSAGRTPTIIGGWTAAALGAGLLTVAIISANNGPALGCLSRPGDDPGLCPTAVAVRTGGLDAGGAAGPASLDSGGLPLAALGLGLLTGGASAAVSATFLDLCGEESWWCLGAGLLLGVATFGVAALGSP